MATPETYLMKPGEVCDLFHIARQTLHDWRTAGRLQAVRHHPRGPWYYPAAQEPIQRALTAVRRAR